jgi:hypothetical protein
MENSDVQPPSNSGDIDPCLRKLVEDVAVIRSNYLTKEDLHKAMESQTWHLVIFICGFNTALAAATYCIARHVG